MHGDVREGEATPWETLLRSARLVVLTQDVEDAQAAAKPVRESLGDGPADELVSTLLVQLEHTREQRAQALATAWQLEEHRRLGLEPN